VRSLFPYLWPHDRADLRFRVVLAMVLLIGGKGIAVTVPMIYKLAVDRLTPGYAAGALLVVPAMLIVAYGVARVGAQLFADARHAIGDDQHRGNDQQRAGGITGCQPVDRELVDHRNRYRDALAADQQHHRQHDAES